ncbi:MAG: cob(I)yrinic acid a,c-diamide adenosyltransferase [Candidatus Pacebacteria bacterium]|nr:cob(I)yrinic acid a,c-diamide adenosyltransferase [Candidatus Paceibacterota bacterium]
MFMVFTGNGKGKTTAAIGQAIRALGDGKRVFMTQFIKSTGYPSGEDGMLPQMTSRTGGLMHFEKGGLGFVGILGDKLPFEEHCAAAVTTLARAKEAMLSGKYDLVILDEVNVALDLKLIDLPAALAFLDAVPASVDVIFTGRYAHSEVLFRADLATRCEELSHPYRGGEKARKGVEY